MLNLRRRTQQFIDAVTGGHEQQDYQLFNLDAAPLGGRLKATDGLIVEHRPDEALSADDPLVRVHPRTDARDARGPAGVGVGESFASAELIV